MNDPISRQAALDVVRKCRVIEVTPAYILIDKAAVMTELMLLPSAESERKKGEWIQDDIASDIFRCSECGNHAPVDPTAGCEFKSNFCPTCGADMRGEQNG